MRLVDLKGIVSLYLNTDFIYSNVGDFGLIRIRDLIIRKAFLAFKWLLTRFLFKVKIPSSQYYTPPTYLE